MAQGPIQTQFLPKHLIKPKWVPSTDTTKNSTITWVVYSDRNKNPTYDGADSKKIFKTLNFMEMFYVVQVSGRKLHIYKDDDPRVFTHSQLTATAVDYGWIDIDKVLPTRFCYYNDENISMKAILLNTTNSAKGNLQDMDFKKVRFYRDPELKSPSDFECNIYQIFYIYDRYPSPHRPTRYLLGRNPKFDVYDTANIVGWVDADRLTVWTHRVAAIPNALPAASTERKTKNIKASVFADNEGAKKMRDGSPTYVSETIWDQDEFKSQEGYDPNLPRYPILSNRREIEASDGVMEIGIIGQVETRDKSRKMSTADEAATKKEYNEKRVNSRHVNILFVIDGTLSMEPYFKGVSAAIEESMKRLQITSQNKYSFAAAIYRDKDDGDDLLFASTGLNNDYSVVAKFLEGQVAESPQDKDLPEAMYYGLTEALKRTGLPTNDQTNYCFLVGDTRDHGARPGDKTNRTQQEVVSLLYNNKCFFSAIQVNHQLKREYEDFTTQSKEIMNALQQKFYVADVDFAHKTRKFQAKPAPSWIPPSTERRWAMKNEVFPGSIRYCYNNMLPPKELTNEIVNTIVSLDSTNNVGISTLQEYFETGDLKSEEVTNTQLTYLSRLKSIPEQNLQILADQHVQLFYEGFSPVNTKLLTTDLWQYDLLLDVDDFSNMLSYFKAIEELSNNETELRQNFITTWKGILNLVLGEKKAMNVENMTLREIEQRVFGAVGTTKLLDYALVDFENPTKIPRKDLMELKQSISQKRKLLESIFEGVAAVSKKYTWISNERKYFWIPQTMLP